MSTRNLNQFAPGPDGIPERGNQVIEVHLAENSRRQGQRQADEGLSNAEPDIAARFLQGIGRDGYAPVNTYEHQLVSGQRGAIASRNPHPSWTDEPEYLDSFFEGQLPQSATSSTEVPGNVYETVMAPPGGGRWHRNDAQARD